MIRLPTTMSCVAFPRKMLMKNSMKNCSRFISSQTNYDIVIVGGGLVGATLACVLGKNSRLSDKSILLLEGSKKRDWKLPELYSNRVSSLNQATYNLLNEIGVWRHIQSSRYGTVKRMQIWEANSEAVINFKGDYSDENLAYIVENDLTLHSVYKELENSNVSVLNEASLQDLKLSKGTESHQLTLKDGSVFGAKLLVGCDGYSSQVRQKIGVHYVSHSYGQMGVVATLELEEQCDNTTAWQKFLPTGPLALLPLNDKFSSLVWTTTPQHAKKLLALTDQDFTDELNYHLYNSPKSNVIVEKSSRVFDQLLHALNCPSTKDSQLPPKIARCQERSRASFPLGFGHATNYVQKGVALVGDAAHRVHPLAGQGVNLGFGDISCLNGVLGEAVYAGSELGDLLYLKEYETERQRHNVPTMLAIDGLYRLYGTDFPPVVLLRSLGLQAVNALSPLKGLLKNHAAS
ncbi:ubiquinone biosynthesis monooxygenase COQ6, mitochondrial [Coccinella septempunctata]|uniref:ubiquinone biosynthesis monooxygenase COQ6, mitochondrial n=1 Tax=Coccinella septempunctata TaxID=41139 RepID=UPI001D05FB5C|nr:ubiquinone biosynthesis monooxygenase COQ6, mitochondrial [Coccinella septempunctata]